MTSVFHHLWDQLLANLGKLASFSIVFTAINLIIGLRQARLKRNAEEARAIRELLNTAGTKANLLNWSLIGNPEISAGILEVRELIEERLGKSPSQPDLDGLMANRLLIEAIIEKGWRKAGISARYQQEALNFGKLQSDLGDHLPLIHIALEAVSTRLRMLFLSDIFAVHGSRDAKKYSLYRSATSAKADPISRLHNFLSASVQLDDKDEFSKACALLEQFAVVVSPLDDKRVLRVWREHSLSASRFKAMLARFLPGTNRRDEALLDASSRKFLELFPNESTALSSALKVHVDRAQKNATEEKHLRRSTQRISSETRNSLGHQKLSQATEDFFKERSRRLDKDVFSLNLLFGLKYEGVNDPQVDFIIASMTPGTDVTFTESALARGANEHTTLGQTLARHARLLSGENETWSSLIRETSIERES